MTDRPSKIVDLSAKEIAAVSGGTQVQGGLPHHFGDRHVGESTGGRFWRALKEFFTGEHTA